MTVERKTRAHQRLPAKSAGGLSFTFESLAVGDRWRRHGRTEAELVQSCRTSGDWHPIHADEAFAADTTAGQPMFQGTYGVHVEVEIAGKRLASDGKRGPHHCSP